MSPDSVSTVHLRTTSPGPHLAAWELPKGWAWGEEGLQREYRHYQEVVDPLGRSLSLVSVPDPEHQEWLHNEAKVLAHRNHPSIPTTYHYWSANDYNRGPGYLRRWIAGETVRSRVARLGSESIPVVFQLLREAASTLAYIHDTGGVHGAISAETIWLTPGGRLWLLGWEWAMPRDRIPAGLRPSRMFTPTPPEWGDDEWVPSPLTDQWQLAAMLFTAVTGENVTVSESIPVLELRADCPQVLARAIERALDPDPGHRYETVASMLREVDRGVALRTVLVGPGPEALQPSSESESAENRLRWATSDDYEILAPLGSGMYGSVWRARDLTLSREVAIKALHPNIARDDVAVARFRREARVTAQLAHPAIVPIYHADGRGDVVWYTMELAEGGSLASLVERQGPRSFDEVAPQVDDMLGALSVAHGRGIIHRDMKPENILIDRYRKWRIADFGIAHALGEGLAGNSGTPAFAAPEQLLGEEQGPATDCYALASIVFFALAGHPPFGDGRSEQILAKQLSENYRDIIAAPHFPEPLYEWLVKGLEPSVKDRFADADEMQTEWRYVVRAMRYGEHQRPWWRRLIEGPSLLTDDVG